MKKLFTISGIVGLISSGTILGMPNFTEQGNFINGNNSNMGSISSGNMEDREIFLPLMKRRHSEGMISPGVRYDWKKRKRCKNSNHASTEKKQTIRERSVKSVANESPSGNEYGGLITPSNASVDTEFIQSSINQRLVCSPKMPTDMVQPPITDNIKEDMMFLPILRPNNRNQIHDTHRTGYANTPGSINSNLLQQQYSYQGYFSLTGLDSRILDPTFNISEVLQIMKQQKQIEIKKLREEIYQNVVNLEQQNEVLKKEIQYYKDNGQHVFPDKIAKLEEQIMDLNMYIKKQNEEHADKVQQLQTQLHKNENLDQLIALKQENEELEKKIQHYQKTDNQKALQEIETLRKKIKELKNQLQEEKIKHENEVKELNEQLKQERELNVTLNLCSESVLKKILGSVDETNFPLI